MIYREIVRKIIVSYISECYVQHFQYQISISNYSWPNIGTFHDLTQSETMIDGRRISNFLLDVEKSVEKATVPAG